ncbi:MAG: molybdenum cofactor guanylyltransferase [Nitrososphaeria archaeon]
MVNGLSAAVLAGGRSSRMGIDKAFLRFNGRPFVQVIAEKLSSFSDDVMVIVGRKDPGPFRAVLPQKVRILMDSVYTMSPIGGIMTAAMNSHHGYFAVIATDMPLIDVEVIKRLRALADGHSAVVPVLKGKMEPLCSVYSSDALKTVDINDVKAVRDMVNLLPDAVFVDAEGFREIDPELSSFRNVNTTEDYLKLNDSARKVIDL